MEFKSIRLGDLLVINNTLYHTTHIFSVPTRYQIQLTHYPKSALPIPITITGNDYKKLCELGSLYFIGNIKENPALLLLYS